MTHIYALKDGKDVFYIGKTKNPKKRKSEHLMQALRHSDKDLYRKIREMVNLGRMFDLEVIKTCKDADADKEEHAMIVFYSLMKNSNIVNVVHKKTGLNSMERQVLILLSEDKDTNDIAKELYRSPRTIETVRQRLKEKAKVKTLTGLIMWGINNDIITY